MASLDRPFDTQKTVSLSVFASNRNTPKSRGESLICFKPYTGQQCPELSKGMVELFSGFSVVQ